MSCSISTEVDFVGEFKDVSNKHKCVATPEKNDKKIGGDRVMKINTNIYRYKFADDFTCELSKFSKIHQYDHRNDFKEAWDVWVKENNNCWDGVIWADNFGTFSNGG